MNSICNVCPRHCSLSDGQVGYCKARVASNGNVICLNYGRITSLALDPIEKKPLRHFHSGKMVLSVGSYGCNMNCFFCQNHEISQSDENIRFTIISPSELVEKAEALKADDNIGIAFTYNEPAIGWEYVVDAGKIVKENGLSVVMVTNGCFCDEIVNELISVVDAFNIDLKCFTEEGYRDLGGDLSAVNNTIKRASDKCHVEVTSLIVPGLNDDESSMDEQAAWLADISADITLHISRYFPNWKSEIPATPVEKLKQLAEVAGVHLKNVHLGNI